jgi:hypothetical protein
VDSFPLADIRPAVAAKRKISFSPFCSCCHLFPPIFPASAENVFYVPVVREKFTIPGVKIRVFGHPANCEFFVTGKNIKLKQQVISFWTG